MNQCLIHIKYDSLFLYNKLLLKHKVYTVRSIWLWKVDVKMSDFFVAWEGETILDEVQGLYSLEEVESVDILRRDSTGAR